MIVPFVVVLVIHSGLVLYVRPKSGTHQTMHLYMLLLLLVVDYLDSDVTAVLGRCLQ